MGSLSECRIEGFICRLCSQIDRNVIHIYTDEGKLRSLARHLHEFKEICSSNVKVGRSKPWWSCKWTFNRTAQCGNRFFKFIFCIFPGLQKKLEQKINVYLKINVSPSHDAHCNSHSNDSKFFQLSRFDPLPKVICLPCDVKLEQHHRFIQRVIQNQKKIQGERPGERPIIVSLTFGLTENKRNNNFLNFSLCLNNTFASAFHL